jgi:hypothetical protein
MALTNKQQSKILGVGLLGAVLALGLAGCRDFKEFDEYYDSSDAISHGAGNAVAHNIAVHTVDPWPRHSDNNKINVDGKRLIRSIEKYRAGKVAKHQGSKDSLNGTASERP